MKPPLKGNEAVIIENVSKVFKVKKNPFKKASFVQALKGVSLVIPRGIIYGIVGESGSGKTTLAKIITEIEKPTSGSVEVRGRVQMVFQDPYSSLNPRMRVKDIVVEPVEVVKKLTRREKLKLAGALLEEVGLSPEDMDKYPHEFSGGQRQRIAIARAISVKPDILVLDEPTSSLDVFAQAQVLNLLVELHRQTGATYIFITHNIPLVVKIAQRIAVMCKGEVVEEADALRIFNSPQHSYTKRLISSVPSRILELVSRS